MRKTLLGIVCAALAASLFAEREYWSGTGFEGMTRDASPKPEYNEGPINLLNKKENGWECWGTADGISASAGEGCATVMTYGSQAKPEEVDLPERMDEWQANAYYDPDSGANTKYLELDTGTTLIARRIGENIQGKELETIGDSGIYIDAKVQFSVTDPATPPEAGVDDKLLVWLSDNSDAGVTNLMVMAGSYENAIYSTKTYTIPVTCVSIVEEQWYRLTIVAEMYVYNKGDVAEHDTSTARFRIYVDGKQVVADDGTDAFLSMIKSQGKDYEKIHTIGFTGHGCVDDIVFATESPFERPQINYSINLGEGVASFDYQIRSTGGEVVDSGTGISDTLVIANSTYNRKTVVITNVTYEDGYLQDSNSPTSGIISENGGFTITARTAGFTVVADGETTNYATMTEVLGAIAGKSSVTITLNSDYTLEGDEKLTVPANTSVTLDLKGCVLESCNGENSIIDVRKAASSFFLKDSVGYGVVRYAKGVDVTEGAYVILGTKAVTIGENPTDTFKLCSAPVHVSGSDSSLTINGGMFEALPQKGSVEITDYSKICPRGWTLGKASPTDEYYTLQPTGEAEAQEVSADEVSATEYDTEEAAQAAAGGIVIVAPNAGSLTQAEKQVYSMYVEAKVVASGEKYVVSAVFSEGKAEELQQVADGAAAAALAADGDGQLVVDPAVPGLYYTLEQGAALPLEKEETVLVETGETSVTFKVEKDAAQGFYRIKISPTEK